MNFPPLLLAALTLGLLRPVAVRAQDISPALDMTLMTGWAGGAAVQMDLERRAGMTHAEATAKANAATEVSSARRAAHLTYSPTATLKQQTVSNLVNRLKPRNPTGAKVLADAFGPGKKEYGQYYQEAIKTTAFADNDAAAALAAYLELGYQIVNNILEDKTITPVQERGLRAQAAGMLSENRALDSPAAVARLGEELKLQTVVLLLLWDASRKNGQEATFRANIAKQFQQDYHLVMSQVRFTDQGITKK